MMSQKEFQRVKVLENAAGGRLSVREAARLLQLSERQVQRLKRRYRPDDLGWVQHGNRGRPMPWAFPLPQKVLILHLARTKYQGLNDSHLCRARFSHSAPPLRSGRLPQFSLPARRQPRPRCNPRDRAIALPPRRGQRGYAGDSVELSHQRDGSLLVFRGDQLLLTQALLLQQHSDRRPALRTTAQKRKTPLPPIYNLSGRPAVVAVT